MDGDCSHKIKRLFLLGRKALTNLDSILKSRDVTMLMKVHIVKTMIFLVVMYRCESWTIKKAACQKLMLPNCGAGEDKSPLDSKDSKPVSSKGNQPWISIGKSDAEDPIFWQPDLNGWLVEKDLDAGKHWRQEGKGMTEDEMAGWHHWLNRHEFEQTPGGSEGQGSLQSLGSQRVRHY